MISVVFKSGHPLGRIRVEFGWLHGAPAAPQAVRVLLWRDDFIARPAARAAGAAKICCARRGRAVATEVQCISDSVNTSAHPEARGKTAKRAKRARGRMTHQPPQLRTIEDPPTVGALLLLFEPPCPPLTPGMTAPGTTRLVPLNPGVTTAGATPGASAAALRAPGTPPLPPMPIVPRYGARNVPPTCSTLVLRARRRPKRRDPTRGEQAQVARMTPEALQMTPLEHGGARDPRVTGEVPTEARETSDRRASGEPVSAEELQPYGTSWRDAAHETRRPARQFAGQCRVRVSRLTRHARGRERRDILSTIADIL